MARPIRPENVLKHSMESQYKRLCKLVDTIPEGCNLDLDENSKHLATAKRVWCIEEEWILNPRLRDELSLLQTNPEDDEIDDPEQYV